MELLTIVIPLYTRYDRLKRVLTYYKDHNSPFNIMILDDSPDQNIDDDDLRVILNDKHIKHIMYEQHMSVAKKISVGMSKVLTPYAVLCADDDFIAPNGLEECIEFLEGNPDYVAAHGRHITFKELEPSSKLVVWKMIPNMKSIECEAAVTRFITHFSDYNSPTFYAVHRTEVMQSIWKSSSKYTDDVRYGELLPTLLTVLYGKVKVLDILYAARENHPSSDGHVANRLRDFLIDVSFKKKYYKFKKGLIEGILMHCKVTPGFAGEIVDRAMDEYLRKDCGATLEFLPLKLRAKQIMFRLNILDKFLNVSSRLKKLTPKKPTSNPFAKIPFQDSDRPEHPDFLRIKTIVELSN